MLAFTAGPLMMLALPVAYVVFYTAFIIDLSLNDCLSLHISALLSLDCFVVWRLTFFLSPVAHIPKQQVGGEGIEFCWLSNILVCDVLFFIHLVIVGVCAHTCLFCH